MLRLLRAIASVVATIALSLSLAAAGLWVCCLPVTTELLARTTSGSENPATPFSQDALVEAAVATRDYTVGSHDLTALYETLWSINAGKIPDLTDAQRAAIDEALSTGGPTAIAAVHNALAELDIEHVLDTDAISHLDDVNTVISDVGIGQIVAIILLLICLILLGVRGGIRWVGGVLVAGGLVVLLAFAAFGIWALVDFNGLFTAIHGVFFTQGNWTFDIDSLLITMYPTNFWIGMGVVWLATTLLLSGLCVAIGAILRR